MILAGGVIFLCLAVLLVFIGHRITKLPEEHPADMRAWISLLGSTLIIAGGAGMIGLLLILLGEVW